MFCAPRSCARSHRPAHRSATPGQPRRGDRPIAPLDSRSKGAVVQIVVLIRGGAGPAGSRQRSRSSPERRADRAAGANRGKAGSHAAGKSYTPAAGVTCSRSDSGITDPQGILGAHEFSRPGVRDRHGVCISWQRKHQVGPGSPGPLPRQTACPPALPGSRWRLAAGFVVFRGRHGLPIRGVGVWHVDGGARQSEFHQTNSTPRPGDRGFNPKR